MANKTNCTKGGKEYYRISADYGLNADGSRNRKEFYGKNKKEAEAKKEDYEHGLKCGLIKNYDKACLGELMHLWLFEIVRMSSKIRPTTFERYEGLFRNYVKNTDLYFLKLDNLKTIIFQRHYNQLFESGKTSSQIQTLNKLLKKFLFYCVDEGFILKNPLQNKSLSIPGKNEMTIGDNEEKEVITFTDEEIKKLRAAIENHRLRLFILLALSTGLRLGELLALTWEDVYDGMVHVNKSLKHSAIVGADGTKEYKFFLLPPKTKSSYRAVPYPTELEKEFTKHKALQSEERLKAGPIYADGDNYIFKTPVGTPTDPHNLRKTYTRILKAAGIEYKKFHALRHTYATKLFEAGIPPKTVQHLLGHASIIITMNIYTHVMPEQKTNAVEVLNKFLL
nr:site-specific integrase [uncultured Aminipila sp.]